MVKVTFLTLLAVTLCSLTAVNAGVDPECVTVDGSVSGDPHFAGFNGQKFDFHGTPFRVYALVKHEEMQMNALFVPDPAFEGKTVIGEVGFVTDSSSVLVACNSKGLFMKVGETEVEKDVPFTVGDDGYVAHFSRSDVVEASIGSFHFYLRRHKTRSLGCFIDVDAEYMNSGSSQSPRGILGQTVHPTLPVPTEADATAFEVRDGNVLSLSTVELVGRGDIDVEDRSFVHSRRLLQTNSCGCNETTAINYDAAATKDDGTCVYVDATSDVNYIMLTGDCATFDVASAVQEIADSLGVAVEDIDIEDAFCEPSAARLRSRRRLLATGNAVIIFSVVSRDTSANDTAITTAFRSSALPLTLAGFSELQRGGIRFDSTYYPARSSRTEDGELGHPCRPFTHDASSSKAARCAFCRPAAACPECRSSYNPCGSGAVCVPTGFATYSCHCPSAAGLEMASDGSCVPVEDCGDDRADNFNPNRGATNNDLCMYSRTAVAIVPGMNTPSDPTRLIANVSGNYTAGECNDLCWDDESCNAWFRSDESCALFDLVTMMRQGDTVPSGTARRRLQGYVDYTVYPPIVIADNHYNLQDHKKFWDLLDKMGLLDRPKRPGRPGGGNNQYGGLNNVPAGHPCSSVSRFLNHGGLANRDARFEHMLNAGDGTVEVNDDCAGGNNRFPSPSFGGRGWGDPHYVRDDESHFNQYDTADVILGDFEGDFFRTKIIGRQTPIAGSVTALSGVAAHFDAGDDMGTTLLSIGRSESASSAVPFSLFLGCHEVDLSTFPALVNSTHYNTENARLSTLPVHIMRVEETSGIVVFFWEGLKLTVSPFQVSGNWFMNVDLVGFDEADEIVFDKPLDGFLASQGAFEELGYRGSAAAFNASLYILDDSASIMRSCVWDVPLRALEPRTGSISEDATASDVCGAAYAAAYADCEAEFIASGISYLAIEVEFCAFDTCVMGEAAGPMYASALRSYGAMVVGAAAAASETDCEEAPSWLSRTGEPCTSDADCSADAECVCWECVCLEDTPWYDVATASCTSVGESWGSTRTSSSAGDPHIQTFDEGFHNMFDEGDFVYMETVEGTSVHGRHTIRPSAPRAFLSVLTIDSQTHAGPWYVTKGPDGLKLFEGCTEVSVSSLPSLDPYSGSIEDLIGQATAFSSAGLVAYRIGESKAMIIAMPYDHVAVHVVPNWDGVSAVMYVDDTVVSGADGVLGGLNEYWALGYRGEGDVLSPTDYTSDAPPSCVIDADNDFSGAASGPFDPSDTTSDICGADEADGDTCCAAVDWTGYEYMREWCIEDYCLTLDCSSVQLHYANLVSNLSAAGNITWGANPEGGNCTNVDPNKTGDTCAVDADCPLSHSFCHCGECTCTADFRYFGGSCQLGLHVSSHACTDSSQCTSYGSGAVCSVHVNLCACESGMWDAGADQCV